MSKSSAHQADPWCYKGSNSVLNPVTDNFKLGFKLIIFSKNHSNGWSGNICNSE
eukprot:CAMPEP_0197005472 /NCGR_PEP_ID=MMETSP1380-20130617/29546_1 /TAXON_ID=5936 /ORGANISM="Euplotes crassus, Strain CT5" /LENGTH=53 /DNA_ID=CAMNT_0042424625 /DNA_START=329 /DNA_END=490 /DNA_ORIENTATION=+